MYLWAWAGFDSLIWESLCNCQLCPNCEHTPRSCFVLRVYGAVSSRHPKRWPTIAQIFIYIGSWSSSNEPILCFTLPITVISSLFMLSSSKHCIFHQVLLFLLRSNLSSPIPLWNVCWRQIFRIPSTNFLLLFLWRRSLRWGIR